MFSAFGEDTCHYGNGGRETTEAGEAREAGEAGEAGETDGYITEFTDFADSWGLIPAPSWWLTTVYSRESDTLLWYAEELHACGA